MKCDFSISPQCIGRPRARLRPFCHYPRVRWLAPLIAVTCLVVQPACPGKGGGGGATARMPAAVRTYEALRWVSADVSYAFVGKRTADISDLLRVLAEVGGIPFDVDPEEVSAESRSMFGYDVLSVESIAAIGIDPERGAAIFSSGLSPTVAAPLADPARLETFVEGMRDSGVAMQTQVSGGVEVFTIRFDGSLSVSWAVVDGWVLARLELAIERAPELEWFESARAAAGAFGGDADFLASLDAARQHATAISAGDGPPVVGVVRPGKVADTVEAIALRMSPQIASMVGGCTAPLRDSSRALIAAGASETGASGSMVVELVDSARISGSLVAAPAGWFTARDGAPLQVDLGLDITAYARTLERCPIDIDLLAGFGVRTVHVAAHAFEDGLPSRAALYADLSDDRVVRAMLRDIPGLGTFSKSKKRGDLDVVYVSVPFFLDAIYHLSPNRAAAAIGDGLFDQIFATGTAVPGELLHIDLRPHDIPTEVLDLALQYGADVAVYERRQRTIARLRRWDRGTIDARLDGARVIVTAAGTRHR